MASGLQDILRAVRTASRVDDDISAADTDSLPDVGLTTVVTTTRSPLPGSDGPLRVLSIDAGVRHPGVCRLDVQWAGPAYADTKCADVPCVEHVRLPTAPVFLYNATCVPEGVSVNELRDDEIATFVAKFVESLRPLAATAEVVLVESPDKYVGCIPIRAGVDGPPVRWVADEHKVFVRAMTVAFVSALRVTYPHLRLVSFPSTYKCAYLQKDAYLPDKLSGVHGATLAAWKRHACEDLAADGKRGSDYSQTRRRQLKAVSCLHTQRILREAGFLAEAEQLGASDNTADCSDAFTMALSWVARVAYKAPKDQRVYSDVFYEHVRPQLPRAVASTAAPLAAPKPATAKRTKRPSAAVSKRQRVQVNVVRNKRKDARGTSGDDEDDIVDVV